MAGDDQPALAGVHTTIGSFFKQPEALQCDPPRVRKPRPVVRKLKQ